MRQSSTVLGLDLGSTSVGWALVDKNHSSILGIGTRIFDPGVDSAEKFARGGEESKAKARREARQQRRMTKRRAQRLKTTYALLAEAQLLPPITGNGPESVQRNEILQKLDLELLRKRPPRDSAGAHLLCYRLRALALHEKLEPYELGRALYHLAQRRGFRSNRLETSKKKDEKGKVEAGISELETSIKTAGVQTLGEFFATLDPTQERIRRRWTSREMYEREFEAICDAQARLGDKRFSGDLRQRLHHAIFHQRPLRSSKHLIGKCELEPKAQRAPKATLIAQEFRLLQAVNDLRVVNAEEHPLSDEQRRVLIQALQDRGDQKFAKIKQLLGLPKDAELNLEKTGENGIRGNRVRATMLSAFGNQWDDLAPEQQDAFVEEWRTLESPSHASFIRRATKVFGLSTEAEQLAAKVPESGYLNLSRRALRKLLPLMREGAAYAAAKKQIYDSPLSGGGEHAFLPPFSTAFPALRNPAVERAMGELRKVVNAVVRRYGKPDAIRIELARDLKRNRKQRQRMATDMREREKERNEIQVRILRECGLENLSRKDVEKALLWQECGGICPYTGRNIDFCALYSGGQVDVEHIIPESYFPDDSFINKTLCWQDFNRNVKRNRTPREALGSTPEFGEILERVRRFKGNARLEKLRRFELDVRNSEEFDSFTQRRLSDTRYISSLASDYVGLLYGGRDQDGARKVFASSGTVTATLRRRWGLEAILREPEAAANAPLPSKPRSDHRHHAIDALVVALTSEAAVQRLAAAASAGSQQRGVMRISTVEGPWPNFVPSVKPSVDRLIVSHRVNHRLNGPLHNETNYAETQLSGGGRQTQVRKPLSEIKAPEVQNIVDKAVREAVTRKLEELGGDLKKLQAACSPGLASYDPPYLQARDGRRIPIVRVRVALNLNPVPIGENDFRRRMISPAGNHHMAFFEVAGKKGKRTWDAVITTRLDAVRNQRKGFPVIEKTLSDDGDAEFVFALMGGDLVEMNDEGRRTVFVTRTISENDLVFVRHNDARKLKDLKQTKLRLRSYEEFRKRNPRKVQVTPLGEIYPAND